ncbi:MAG TPA: hypothetical protein VM943_09840 [Pyrinomonadaceae bacterium]|nr:hypothetical protein [Pyrinomonadaceae bacterium]
MNNSDRSAAAVFLSPAGPPELPKRLPSHAAFDNAGRGCLRDDPSARRASIPSINSISQSECNGFALHPARDKGARLAAQRLAGRTPITHALTFSPERSLWPRPATSSGRRAPLHFEETVF